jgi:hypothetical protein
MLLTMKPVDDSYVWFVDAILACQAVDNGTRPLLVGLRQIVRAHHQPTKVDLLARLTCQVDLLLDGSFVTVN